MNNDPAHLSPPAAEQARRAARLRPLTWAQRRAYNALTLAGGHAKAADIAYHARTSTAYITTYLDQLADLGVIERGPQHPFPTYTINRRQEHPPP